MLPKETEFQGRTDPMTRGDDPCHLVRVIVNTHLIIFYAEGMLFFF
jgi:hypothetical protein